ncbi:MAG: FtsX-like permease family protein [Lautropia sp.]
MTVPQKAIDNRAGGIAPLRLSLILLRRDWRAGELRLLVVALAVAVAAISTVGFFIDRLGSALSGQATQMLGGDVVVSSDHAISPDWIVEARRRGLNTAQTVGFPSMALAAAGAAGAPDDRGKRGDRGSAGEGGGGGDRPGAGTLPLSQLASVKAVSTDYPLRDGVTVTSAQVDAAAVPGADPPQERLARAPDAGSVWVDRALLQSLGLAQGDRLQLGEKTFQIDRVILIEPDRGTSFINFAPRVMLALDDLAATRLVQAGSRVTYRLLVAGDRNASAGFEAWVKSRLRAGQRMETLEAGRPELRMTLDRSQQFLSLVSLLSALIAAVAIGLAARRFAERHLDGFAVLKALGAAQRLLVWSLLFEMLWLALAGAAVGALVGWVAHWALVVLASSMIDMPLPAPSGWPALQAAAAGVVLILGFAAVPVLRLAGVPPLRVLRRELGPPAASVWLALLCAIGAFAALLFWYAGDRKVALYAMGGFLGGAVVFALVSLAGVRLLAPLRNWVGTGPGMAALRVALASWSRRRGSSVVQTAALAVGLMALMLLTVTRNDLLDSWRSASPADAPNRFVLNIQPDQRDLFGKLIEDAGLRNVDLYPMIRGRLVAVNDVPIGPDHYQDERARRLVNREFNLSYADRMPGHNQLDSGRWLAPASAEVSAEQGVMDTLGLKINDRARFDVAGEMVDLTIVGTRKLAWDSMKVNFFMIGSPDALRDKPQSFITSFHIPAGKAELGRTLVDRLPNLTVVDTTAILRQVQTMVDQVVRAVQFLFLFALAAGVVVLYAALASSRDERVREAGLMRALGASRRQLTQAQVLELALSGVLAGTLAALGAILVGWVLAHQVFQFSYRPGWWLLPAGAVAGGLFSAAAGWWSLRSVVSTPPMTTLRGA